MKLFGSGNESTWHNTLRFEPILVPTEDLFSNWQLGATEIMNSGKVEHGNSIEIGEVK